MPKTDRLRLFIGLAAGLLFVVSAVFLVWPGLDIYISALFGDAGGFWLAQQDWAQALRHVLMWATRIIAVLALAWLVMAAIKGARAHAHWRFAAFAFISFAIGPWLIVNELFKNNWGRARPQDITEFGGESMFTPAWHIADQCGTNCSFVSGEAGMSAATVLVLLVLFGREMPGWARGLLVALGAMGAGLRIIFGGHFTSDVLISVLICALVVAGCHAVLLRGRGRPAHMWRALLADIRNR